MLCMFGGKVIHGDGVGKQLGYPTANLDSEKNKVKITSGVYAVRVILNHKQYQGALAVQEIPWKVEVHLLDYSGPDFYGAYLEVEPKQKVSEMEKFDNLEELKKKIFIDAEKVQAIFN